MVDTVRVNNTTAAGGPLIAVDAISGSTYAITKMVLGATDVDDGLIHSSNPMPITASGVVSTFAVNSAGGQTSSWIAGQNTPVSTYSVNTPTPAGVQSTYAVNTPTPAGTQSTWVVGAGKTSTHIASQTGNVSTWVVGAAKTSTHIASQTGPVSTYSVGGTGLTPAGVQSTFTVNGGGNTTTYITGQASPVSTYTVNGAGQSSTFITGQSSPVSTYIVSVPKGSAEVSSGAAVNISTVSVVMVGMLNNYAAASSWVGQSSSQPFLADSTGALVVRDLSAAASNANPNSSFIMGSAAGSVPVSTYAVNNPAPVGVQSTFTVNGGGNTTTYINGQASPVSTYIVGGSAQANPSSSFIMGSAAGSVPVSTFAVNAAAPAGVQSTFAVAGSAKTSTHIASQTGPVSTFVVNGAAGGTSATDDSAFTLGSDSGTPAMGVYVSSAAGSIEHGSTAVFRMTSSRAMHIHAPYTVSTYVVTQGSPVGTQSTWPLGVQSTFALNTAAPSGVQSTFAVAGSAKTSTHIAGQTGPVSTFAINTAAPSGTQSTWALNKTSTHIAGQSITLSTVAVPPTTGGLSAAAVVSLTTSAFQVNNAPTQMYGVWFTNSAGTLRWLKFYDAGAVTVGTTPPNFYIGLPPNSTTGWMPPGAHGIQFNTSCFIAATTGQATSDATAPTTNDVTVSVFYKS